MYDLAPTPPAPPPAEPPLPAAVRALTGEDGLATLPLTFWRRHWVQNILPWITSITIHLALIILVLATYKVAAKFGKVIQEQIVIPDASLAPDPGGVPNPGLDNNRDRTASQNIDSSITESQGFSHAAVELADSMKIPTAGGGDEAATLIGMGNGGRGKSGLGPAGGAGGALAQFGNPGGGQIGPHGRVFGNGGNAMRIIYVCDATGSMLGKMDLLKLELEKSVQQLQPIQAFNVIFFQDSVQNPSSHIDLAPDLVMATAGNKKKLYNFLQDIVVQSSTHVIPALTAAFHSPTRPELIYLLTDGAFENETGDVVINAIAKLNADKRVKVNTILFLGRDIDPDELKEAGTAMRRIAKENGGVYNQVMINELEN